MNMKQYLIKESKKYGLNEHGTNEYENELDCEVSDDYGNKAHFSNGSFYKHNINYSKNINIDDYAYDAEFKLSEVLCKKIARQALYTEVSDNFDEYMGVTGSLWHNGQYYAYHFYLSEC